MERFSFTTFVQAIDLQQFPQSCRDRQRSQVFLKARVDSARSVFQPIGQSDSDLAYGSINSKRADFVVVDRRGLAVLAVEYHGHGHYQGNAHLRDAVKREAFRSAGIPLIEIYAIFQKEEVARHIRKILNEAESTPGPAGAISIGQNGSATRA